MTNLQLHRIYSRWFFTNSYLLIYEDIEIIIKVSKVNEVKLYHLCCSIIYQYKREHELTGEECDKLLSYITHF